MVAILSVVQYSFMRMVFTERSNTMTQVADTMRSPTFAEVSRNLDVGTYLRICANETLPSDWLGHAHLELVHRLYWEEKIASQNSQALSRK